MSNPNHVPAGSPDGGQFTEGSGGGSSGGAGNLHDVAKQTGLKVTRESAPSGGGSFESHMAEVQKNLDAVNASRKAGEPGRQRFNAVAQKMFGRNTKVRL